MFDTINLIKIEKFRRQIIIYVTGKYLSSVKYILCQKLFTSKYLIQKY